MLSDLNGRSGGPGACVDVSRLENFVPYWMFGLTLPEILRLPRTGALSVVIAFGLVFVVVSLIFSFAITGTQLIKIRIR